MNRLTQKGFALVEILIVITIIGALATVVLPRLQTARDEGFETKVKTELTIVGKRAAIEESLSLTYDVVCGTDGYTQAVSIADQINSVETFSGETVVCNSSAGVFAVSVPINTTTHWCVDSAGNRIERTTGLGVSEFSCE